MNRQLLTISLLFLFSCSLYAQLNFQFRSQYPYPSNVALSNIWGYVDTLGNEYALVGTQEGMDIIDVSNPVNPQLRYHVPGPNSIWREVRTHQKYAYVTTEGGGGLRIVNLSYLPDSIQTRTWTGNNAINGQLNTIHALHIDNGHIYLYGSNLANGGAIIASLADPWNPNYVGQYNVNYIHDGIVRNDTLWGSHIYQGYFSVIDVSNKTNPVVLQTQNTPTNFTHNTWKSDDNHYLFTTDENSNSFLGCYDVTDLQNIREMDRIQITPNSGSIVHNTYIKNDYAFTSWYTDGVVITDVSRPKNMINVGHYDTSPFSGNGFKGAWGVYAYLPSGNILVSDIEQGMFVLTPTLVRACYVEGVVTDSVCNIPLSNVNVVINGGTHHPEKTNFNGEYYTGTATAGTYTITFSAPGYISKTFNNVVLTNGVLTNINVQLLSNDGIDFSGKTYYDTPSNGLQGVNVLIENTNNNYSFLSDANGEFARCNLIADSYNVYAGKWGYVTTCNTQALNNSNDFLSIELSKGYYDDFTFNYGWTVSGTATSGNWERGVPVGTNLSGIPSNPGADVNSDCSNKAFVTGNNGGSAGDDDVDNGTTILTSPVMDLTQYLDPTLNYYRWFFNAGGSGNPNDSLIVKIDNGITTAVVEVVTASSPNSSQWVNKSFRVLDFVSLTNNTRVIFETADYNPGHIVEAAIDKFSITGSMTGLPSNAFENNILKAYPNPFDKQLNISYHFASANNAIIQVSDISGRIVMQQVLSGSSGNVLLNEQLQSGIYFIHVLADKQVLAVEKVVKQ
jgi:choice-of-anchor B domain-containing protein